VTTGTARRRSLPRRSRGSHTPAGPDGAGKTIFYRAHLEPAGLRFVNADVLSLDLTIDPYEAARVAQEIRQAPVALPAHDGEPAARRGGTAARAGVRQ
jgi:hypothetical protein